VKFTVLKENVEHHAELYAKYRALAEGTPKVHFVGRLATYKYYNMDQIVAQSLTTYGKITSVKRAQAVVMTPGRLGNGNGKLLNEKVLRQELARGNDHGEAGRSV